MSELGSELCLEIRKGLRNMTFTCTAAVTVIVVIVNGTIGLF